MKRIRMVLETDALKLLFFGFATALSVWPFLPERNIISFRTVLLFFFVGWAALVVLLFLMAFIYGRHEVPED